MSTVLFSIADIVLLPLFSQHLRQVGVVGKFVEFFGPGVAQLSIADRATIANMCPEYGATAAFFPVDDVSIQYLEQTGERQAAEYGVNVTWWLQVALLSCPEPLMDVSSSTFKIRFSTIYSLISLPTYTNAELLRL